MAARQCKKFLAMPGTGPVEPPETQHDARATCGRKTVRAGLGGQIRLGHREIGWRACFIDPRLSPLRINHADRFLDYTTDARRDCGVDDGGRAFLSHAVIGGPGLRLEKLRGRRNCRRKVDDRVVPLNASVRVARSNMDTMMGEAPCLLN